MGLLGSQCREQRIQRGGSRGMGLTCCEDHGALFTFSSGEVDGSEVALYAAGFGTVDTVIIL